MAVRSIVVTPSPVLREISTEVDPRAPETAVLVQDMLDTLYDAPGVGLAAVQIGVTKRLVVIDLTREAPRQPQIFINPVIVERSSEETSFREGCLSIPNTMVDVLRPKTVTVRYVGLEGEETVLEAEGILATCLQHEIDHLDGNLITDYGPPIAVEMPKKPQRQD